MKRIFSSTNSAEVGLAQSFLDNVGIAYEVRNDAVSQTLVGMPFAGEIWVTHDEDYAEASALITDFFAKSPG
jgi:hypothetical protein